MSCLSASEIAELFRAKDLDEWVFVCRTIFRSHGGPPADWYDEVVAPGGIATLVTARWNGID